VSGTVRVAAQQPGIPQSGNGIPEAVLKSLPQNWRSLIEFCQQNPFVSMRLNVANGVPVSAEEVVPALRFSNPDPRRGQMRPGSG